MKQKSAFLLVMVALFSCQIVLGQKDSTKFDSKFGGGLNYTGVSLIESAVIELQLKYTLKHHAISLAPHIAYHDLFPGQSDWERYGVSLTYEYFPIRSNRLFSPFLFYDLNYAYSRSRREVAATAPDGLTQYTAAREVTMNGLSHHFGIGTRCNFYKGLFLHLSAGAGPAIFGETVNRRSFSSSVADSKAKESPFANYQTVFMFRVGLAYHFGVSELKKGNQNGCCD